MQLSVLESWNRYIAYFHRPIYTLMFGPSQAFKSHPILKTKSISHIPKTHISFCIYLRAYAAMEPGLCLCLLLRKYPPDILQVLVTPKVDCCSWLLQLARDQDAARPSTQYCIQHSGNHFSASVSAMGCVMLTTAGSFSLSR